MSNQLDLKALERKAWRSMHADGLFDLFFGWMLLVGYLRDVTGWPPVTLLQIAGVLIVILGKHFITVPRMGVVKFGPEREARRLKVAFIIGGSVGALGAVYYAVPHLRAQADLLNLGVTAMLLVVFVAMAWLLDFPRMYFIGIVFAAVNVIRQYTRSPLVFLIAGLVVALPGAILLMRFVRRYPRVQDGGEAA
jgi:hypothetical protein